MYVLASDYVTMRRYMIRLRFVHNNKQCYSVCAHQQVALYATTSQHVLSHICICVHCKGGSVREHMHTEVLLK
jgi:hypothetical protein